MARGTGRTWILVEGGAVAHTLVAPGRLGAGLRLAARARQARAWRSVPRRHQRAGASEGGRSQRGAAAQALGRSRGGHGTKACTICDGRGRALGFALIPGQASELRVAPAWLLIAANLGPLGRVVCDGAYASALWLHLVEETGARPVMRANPTHRNARPYDRAVYRRRHRVENLWARLKEWRAVATRYDKAATSFSGGLYLAAALDRLSNTP
ncbi:IS5 family transposase [Roseomonas sp. E05]|uniref:IS5 family transposase n=1 Tax=Roseomonas sp. E05 TaxID=3046310 RepID=UPI0024B9F929|nr:IS5 family transposase [Roseomonas sp. E05]MDJ0388520.1 IS5 family transposase [Roseomonas sp. E05]